MELTKHGHACVVLSDGDRRLVIDPGAFTDPAALDGATAVLDHPRARRPLRARSGCGRRWTPIRRWRSGPTRRWPAQLEGLGEPGARRRPRRRRRRSPGSTCTCTGSCTRRSTRTSRGSRTSGSWSAGRCSTRATRSRCPTSRCRRCCCRCTRPGRRSAEVIDYVRAVDADQAYAIHDGLLNDTGLGVVGGLLGERRPGHARRPTAGWPPGTRSSSEARPASPGIGSADGAVVPAGERWTRRPRSTAATTIEMIQRIQSTPLVCATPSAPAIVVADEHATDAAQQR